MEAGVQIGWPTRLVSFGPDISAAVFAIGFACRAAMAFGGIKPGDFRKILIYNKDRIFAFVMPLGSSPTNGTPMRPAPSTSAFPTIADTPIPEVLPTGICTYEHVVSNMPHDQIVQKAVEVRGLKVKVTEVPIPVAYGPAFEGERVRGEDIYLECGGGRTQAVELVTSKDMDEVEDGKIEVIGPDINDIQPPAKLPLAMLVEVAGPEDAGGFRADPGAADPPPDQLRPGHHAHRPARHRLDAHIARAPWRKGSSSPISGRSSTPSFTRTSVRSSTRSR